MYAEKLAEDHDPIRIIWNDFPEYLGQTGKLN